MKIIINDQVTITSIQQEFNRVFPYLKLEFFSKHHHQREGSPLKFMQPVDRKLGEIRKNKDEGEILVTPKMRVSELEQLLGNRYGLSVQVFRKAGNSWVETILTDSWTLQEQNDEGQVLSSRPRPEKPDYYNDDIE
jgi:hypothetical protein